MTIEELAQLHARCFQVPRPWAEAEFRDLLSDKKVFLLHRDQGFLIGRVVADEAELLTLAVSPDMRRHGIGRKLTTDFAETSALRGARQAYLEVAANNPAAIALYLDCGWHQVGVRPRYYGPNIDAKVMTLSLRPANIPVDR